MIYPKIETVFDRDERFKVDTSRLRREVYGTIAGWLVTEKVDGTNIRIEFSTVSGEIPSLADPRVEFKIRGKTDSASIPPQLLEHCNALAVRVAPEVHKVMDERGLTSYTLHGEGYGAKIQNGGRYRSDQGFMLFDVQVNDRLFLSDDQVSKTAAELHIPRVPFLNGGELMSLEEIVGLVQGGFASDAADRYDPQFMAEGVVARTLEPLYDNRGERLMWKLKAKDFGR